MTTIVLALVMVDGGLFFVESGSTTAAAGLEGLLLAGETGAIEVVDVGVVGEETFGGGFGVVLGSGSELESWTLPTLFFRPVKSTDQTLSPPPTHQSVST